ncbi:MAG: type IV pilus modification PilV family protein [Armatimonadota bacterium]
MKLLRSLQNKNGTSIIEVLVAMVIFVVGILYVIRMFPGGFSSIKQTENSTVANRLAQSEIERWKSRAENLPSGILPIDPNIPGGLLLNLDPEDMRALSVPAGEVERYFSDVNKFRHVIGEFTKIPAPPPSDDDWYKGAIYILGFSPVVYTNNNPILVYSGPLKRQTLPVDTRWLTWMTNRDYAIDYDEGKIYIRKASYAREFLISYNYIDQSNGNPRKIGLSKIRIPVGAKTDTDPDPDVIDIMAPEPGTGNLVPVINIPGFGGIEPGSETLRRSFIDRTADKDANGDVSWNTFDPYEFVVQDSFAGVLGFNPVGHSYEEITASGREPLKAYIDYDVRDWHIIRDEKKIPSAPADPNDQYIKVRLSLNGIKIINTSNYDGSEYTGLTPDMPYSVVAVDAENGRSYNEESLVDVVNVPAMQVNYKDGIIEFHESLRNRTFTIFYQAVDDWAVQVYKSFDVFRRRFDVPADLESFGYDYYYLSDNGRVYFPRCYAGTTVAIDYTYRPAGQTVQGKFVNGETFIISQDVDSATGLCYVDLVNKLADRGITGMEIAQTSKVYGVSLGARVIWRTSGKGLSSFWRWKKVDIQTYLTRPNN